MEQNEGFGAMVYGCHECGSPAVMLPERLDENAVVHCQGCRKPIATWAAFKHTTTQVILADFKEAGAKGTALSYDPLDPGLLPRAEGVFET
jgi:DNA-directed RNA polymerase subunit RPC12/RpoP